MNLKEFGIVGDDTGIAAPVMFASIRT